MTTRNFWMVLLSWLLIAGCDQNSPATSAGPIETDLPPDPPPTTSPNPNGASEQTLVNGREPEGAFFRGRADAPLVMIDYSDFL